jgi:hypothetical protein
VITSSKIVFALACAASFGAAACRGGSSTPPPTAPTPNAPTLTAPALDGPTGDLQLDTLRPTLSVFNGTSNQTGTRTYEFQIAEGDAFANIILTRTGVAEGAGGRTSFTPDQDLQPTARLHWRARLAQGSILSGWSPTGVFRTRQAGYNRPGELYDPLVQGETVGTRVGATTFVSGKGLRIENASAFVRYELPQTISAGEFSVEVEGLRPNGPDHKLKIMSMFEGPGNLIGSRYESAVHYRGANGNPDNCISFKTVWGDQSIRLEPDLGQRLAAVRALDPAATYLFQALWTSNSFRVVVRQGGAAGSVIYDLTINAPPGTGPYAPTPHYAYLGATSGLFGSDAGSWPGVTYRNVWISTRARPASIGNAADPVE